MKYRVSREFSFSASHAIESTYGQEPESRLHGHNFVIRLTLGSKVLNDDGLILDLGTLDEFQCYVDDYLDCRHLNDVVDVNPTAENMARYIYEWCDEELWPIKSVGWSEKPGTWATYRP